MLQHLKRKFCLSAKFVITIISSKYRNYIVVKELQDKKKKKKKKEANYDLSLISKRLESEKLAGNQLFIKCCAN